ncbi:hypothetical protein V9T40_005419 [Parthenolecanium corni]|uniref:Uncharacterized protein n=1 Tax=Parthenolecanium corni TaxID=536013 RepID=A0AAN9TF32_9HEMI
MPLCGHLLLTVTIWSAFVGCQKPSSVSTRHDVYIAGFFPYTPIEFPESRIGRGVMPAVKLAVEHINDSPQVLRNYRLHMWWNDTKVMQFAILADSSPAQQYTYANAPPV